MVDFEWKNNLLEIKKFTAKIGSGIVDVFGNIRLNGLTPYSYDLSISTPKKEPQVSNSDIYGLMNGEAYMSEAGSWSNTPPHITVGGSSLSSRGCGKGR